MPYPALCFDTSFKCLPALLPWSRGSLDNVHVTSSPYTVYLFTLSPKLLQTTVTNNISDISSWQKGFYWLQPHLQKDLPDGLPNMPGETVVMLWTGQQPEIWDLARLCLQKRLFRCSHAEPRFTRFRVFPAPLNLCTSYCHHDLVSNLLILCRFCVGSQFLGQLGRTFTSEQASRVSPLDLSSETIENLMEAPTFRIFVASFCSISCCAKEIPSSRCTYLLSQIKSTSRYPDHHATCYHAASNLPLLFPWGTGGIKR